MSVHTKTPLILGRTFFSTANAHIDVGAGEIHLNINGKEEKFHFKPRLEQCSSVEIKPPDTTIIHGRDTDSVIHGSKPRHGASA